MQSERGQKCGIGNAWQNHSGNGKRTADKYIYGRRKIQRFRRSRKANQVECCVCTGTGEKKSVSAAVRTAKNKPILFFMTVAYRMTFIKFSVRRNGRNQLFVCVYGRISVFHKITLR